MSFIFRKAEFSDIDEIWMILSAAILRRKEEGSSQWQDGYPNREVIQKDITNKHGYILQIEGKTIGYVAILLNDEPAYDKIEGSWLSYGNFLVFHRIAIHADYLNQGYATVLLQEIEKMAFHFGVNSIKADTNFDNLQMLALFQKLNYQYCGEILIRNSPRKAFEKRLI